MQIIGMKTTISKIKNSFDGLSRIEMPKERLFFFLLISLKYVTI